MIEESIKLSIQNENLLMRNEILEKSQLSYTQKKVHRSLNKYDNPLEEFIIDGVDRSKLASMIYGVSRNKGEGIDLSEKAPPKRMQIPEKSKKPPFYKCIHKGLYYYFVQEVGKS